MKKVRKLLTFMLALLLLLSSAGCSKNSDSDTASRRNRASSDEQTSSVELENKETPSVVYIMDEKGEWKEYAKLEIQSGEINSYFLDALIEECIVALKERNGYSTAEAAQDFYSSGYKIYSTLDPKVQSSLEKVFTDPKYALTNNDGEALQGAMVVQDYWGNIKGIVGGIGKKTENRGYNRATMAIRQPGGIIKPLSAYAPAIDNGLITATSVMEDKEVIYYEGKEYEWYPQNWYYGYNGKMTVDYAVKRNVNTIPVQIVDMLSIETSFSYLKNKFNFMHLNEGADKNYASLGIGGTSGGVTVLESAAAYAVFGNKGYYYEPTTFISMYDKNDELIVGNPRVSTSVLAESTAAEMNSMLQGVIEEVGTGQAVKDYFSDMPTFAATATSNAGEYADDTWFVGGTPYYTAACWCGYDSNTYIAKSYEKTALKMWGEVMAEIHKDLPVISFQ